TSESLHSHITRWQDEIKNHNKDFHEEYLAQNLPTSVAIIDFSWKPHIHITRGTPQHQGLLNPEDIGQNFGITNKCVVNIARVVEYFSVLLQASRPCITIGMLRASWIPDLVMLT
ncbi:hypothetical protein ACJX0J_020852, partial [Zea mays]